MNNDIFAAVIRETSENHDDTPPNCDAQCKRWDGTPHAHICPDGLYNDDTPLVVVTAWCSCGERMGKPVTLDARNPRLMAQRSAASGRDFMAAFNAHMRLAHDIDVYTDEDWLEKLATKP